jgi:hypothetical protein
MAEWLRKEEMPFAPSDAAIMFDDAVRTRARRPTVTVSLRGVRVLNNRKLFGSARVRVLTVVVDGNRDNDGDAPFWRSELDFPGVGDGATLPIDPEFGYLVYRGRPWGFLSLFVLVAKDTEATRQFAQTLKENFLAKGIGAAAGAATIFAGAPMAAEVARQLAAGLVDTTLEVLAKKKNPLIATYYGSVTKEQKYGPGLHPSGYPSALIDCGATAQIAYEIASSSRS